MILSSPQFADGTELPFFCSYDAENKSPPLSWSDIPKGVASFALTCIDQTDPANTWTHWLIWNIPGTETFLPEGMGQYPQLDNGIRQGPNNFFELGWGGPCPPNGKHLYVFNLYALDCLLDASFRTIHELRAALTGHVLDIAELSAVMESEKPMVSWERLREGYGAYNGIR